MTREQHGREASDRYGEYAVDGAEGAPEVHSITSAAPGHSVDMHQRMVRYAVAMGIRVVCIVALFFLDGWFKLIAVAGAVFLPWIAVVIANAQTQGEEYDSELMDHISYGELGAGRSEDADPAASPPHGETILGETVDDDPDREEPAGQDQDGGAAPRRTGSEPPEAGAA